MTQIKKPVAMVSGASGTIGKAIADGIAKGANKKGVPQCSHELVLLCRSEEKAQATQEELKQSSGNPDITYRIVDMADHDSIKRLRASWSGPLHVLVNNAADTPQERQETKAGLELQFATNIMGYFWLIYHFQDILKQSTPARVINVASYWAGGLALSDLQFQRRRYDNDSAYRQAKQANRMLSRAFAGRLKPYGVSVNSCHPGDVNSALSNSLGFGGNESPKQGAQTPVWLATQLAGIQNTGKYFENRRETKCHFSDHTKDVEALYRICEQYV